MTLTENDNDILTQIKIKIDNDPSRHYKINDLAIEFGIGETRLKIGFKRLYGKGVYSYTKEMRLISSADMLLNSTKTIKQIAKASGYKFRASFIVAFSKYYKIPPTKFRKSRK